MKDITKSRSLRPATTDVVRSFNPYLHGARGLFAFLIVIFHVVNSQLQTFDVMSHGWLLFMTRSLEHGVELFFGISGIVIYGALKRARGPLIFTAERATRIYPVLWASVTTIVLLAGLTHFQGRSLPTIPVFLENLLGLPPIFPGPLIHPAAWSLNFELVFYSFCAFAWALRRRIGGWSFFLTIPLAAILIGFHVRGILMPVGMIVAFALARNPQSFHRVVAPGFWLVAFLIAWQGVSQLSGGDLMHINVLQLRGVAIPLAVIAVVSATFSFAGLLGGRGAFCWILGSPILQFLGSISYSLYLWHPIIMSIVKHFMYVSHIVDHAGPYSQTVFLILSLPPSLAAARISEIILERRVTMWLRRRLEARARGRDPIQAPVTVSHPHMNGQPVIGQARADRGLL